MSLLADAVVIAGGIFVGRLIARTFRRRRAGSQSAPLPEPRPAGRADAFEGWPCRLGDVVVRRTDRQEAWLAGGLVFAEDLPIAALFLAPDAQHDHAVFVRPGSVVWLSAVQAPPPLPLGEPPPTIEVDGGWFDRDRRLPVHVSAVGTGAPSVGQQAVIGEYHARGGEERLVVVAGVERAWVGRGVALATNDYDVLPAGEATLGGPS